MISPYHLKCNCNEYFVVIASRIYAGDIFRGLTSSFFPRENIWFPKLGTMYATTGKQYFDCPELEPLGEEEIFIDAGCFDGETSREFAKWSGGKYKHFHMLHGAIMQILDFQMQLMGGGRASEGGTGVTKRCQKYDKK